MSRPLIAGLKFRGFELVIGLLFFIIAAEFSTFEDWLMLMGFISAKIYAMTVIDALANCFEKEEKQKAANNRRNITVQA